MKTKLSTLKEFAEQGNWQKAIAVAAKFQDLGTQRNAILDAHTAYTNPRWLLCLGRDIEAAKESGRLALIDRYSIEALV